MIAWAQFEQGIRAEIIFERETAISAAIAGRETRPCFGTESSGTGVPPHYAKTQVPPLACLLGSGACDT